MFQERHMFVKKENWDKLKENWEKRKEERIKFITTESFRK
jgi:hypothetical protein